MEGEGEREGRCCVVLGCQGGAERIYPFPKESKLRSRWCGATGRTGGYRPRAREGDGVCGRHFAPEHYRAGVGGALCDHAVPALHLPPRGQEAEMRALAGSYSSNCLRRLAHHTSSRPVLQRQPPPPPADPAHEAHRAALADLAIDLRLDPDLAQARLDRYLTLIYDRILSWCRLRAKYELGGEERAMEVAPDWMREAEELRAGGAGGMGAAAQLWRGLAERARALRTLDLRVVLGEGRPVTADLEAVWTRGVELARARLDLLTRVGDDEGALHPGARPSFHMEDLLVLLEPDAWGAEGEGSGVAPGAALALLFGLVQKYRLEEGEGGASVGQRWGLAAREYRSRHRAASVLLLQRRWHRLKLAALRSPSSPPLHAALLRRFPHLHHSPPLPWHELVSAGGVVERELTTTTGTGEEPLEEVATRFQEPIDDDDVILIEKHIDTYEISDDEGSSDESDDKSSYISNKTPTVQEEQQQQQQQQQRDNDTVAVVATRDDSDCIDVKLTLSPVVVVHELTSWPGWKGAVSRTPRHVDLRRLRIVHPSQHPSPPPPPRRSIANTIVFEDEDEDDPPPLTICLSEDAVCGEGRRTGESRDPDPDPDPDTSTVPTRKKVQLPDIEQVRKQNRNMLTAEVLPCPAGTRPGATGAGVTGAGAGRYCCWALRSRAMTAARARHALNSGRLHRRLVQHTIDLHRSHCTSTCACCCAGADRGTAGAGLAAEQLALDDRLLRLLPALDERPPLPPPPTGPALRPAPPARPTPKPRTKKRRAPSPPYRSPTPPPSDDLQEWIRQKNLTARFFDLNLKRPARPPAPAPAPAPAAASPPEVVDPRQSSIHTTNILGPENVTSPLPPPPPPTGAPWGAATVPVTMVSAPRLEMMSVSEDEEPSPPPPPLGPRVGAGGRVEGSMKIVTIRRNPENGQRVIVVRPATQGNCVKVTGATASRAGGTTASPDSRSNMVVVASRLAETDASDPGDHSYSSRTAAPVTVSDASDPGDHSYSSRTAAPVTVSDSAAAPMTLTVSPMTVTPAPAPTPADLTPPLVFQALPSNNEDEMFKDNVVRCGQVSWAGRPLVMACCRLQAPWAPLLGWYMLTEEGGEGGDVEYWVFGETMYRLESLPAARRMRLVHGVRDARSCRALAVRGAPLLALHVSSRRVLRVAARRHGDRLLLRAAVTHLAQRLAEALNAAPAAPDEAVVQVMDVEDDDDNDVISV